MGTTIYTQLDSDVKYKNLDSKAEESYDGGEGGIDDYSAVPKSYYVTTVASTVSGAWSDMSTGDKIYYPIDINILWEKTPNGLTINSLQMINHAPSVALTVSRVTITNGNTTHQFDGPEKYAGNTQTLNMPINMNLSNASSTTIDINLGVYFGFPKYRDIGVFLPKGYEPPPGCSIIPYKRDEIW
jgi:hypothetical protein